MFLDVNTTNLASVMSQRSLASTVGGRSTCVHDLSGLLVRRRRILNGAVVLSYGAAIGLVIEAQSHSRGLTSPVGKSSTSQPIKKAPSNATDTR